MRKPPQKRRSGGTPRAKARAVEAQSPTPNGTRATHGRATVPAHVARVVAARASGDVRRKNLNVDQGLLDQARTRLGLKTETQAVELGLGALLELAEFQTAMVDGFDDLMATGGLRFVEDEEMDLTGFPTR